jgi:uncharacterized protein (DUF924 family)
MNASQEVLDFWLGDAAISPDHARQQKKLWYRSSAEIDQEIETRFADLHRRAAAGELEDWQQSPEGSLALVIVLDQFSRHLYRGEPGAFAYDALALKVARDCPEPKSLPLIARAFLLHPFEHAEDPETQQESVQQFEQLLADADEPWQNLMANFLTHAKEHADIVLKFGRFPHRNPILGRQNTPEEDTYLASSGKTFGQRVKAKPTPD